MDPRDTYRLLPKDPEIVRRVYQVMHRREQAALRKEAAEVATWSAMGSRRLRLPDGTHIQYKIPKLSYHYWGKRLGYECWEDHQFVHEFLRDNPQCRVTSEALNATILSGWAPTSPAARLYRNLQSLESAKSA